MNANREGSDVQVDSSKPSVFAYMVSTLFRMGRLFFILFFFISVKTPVFSLCLSSGNGLNSVVGLNMTEI